MPALTIRTMEDGDADAVVALWERCGLTRPWNDPHADIAFARKVPNATILVGCLAETVVACTMVGHDGHRGTVYYVSIEPELQNQGHGRTIMQAAEDWLRGQGVWKLNLIVRAENTAVMTFYSRLGYEPEQRVNMAKWLDPARKPLSQTGAD